MMVNSSGRLHVNEEVTPETVAWWRMSCGRVLGMLNGMLIEYDKSTLAPLGLVVGADELVGKRVAVVDSGLPEECVISEEVGMEGAECADVWNEREQSVILYDTVAQNVVVIVRSKIRTVDACVVFGLFQQLTRFFLHFCCHFAAT